MRHVAIIGSGPAGYYSAEALVKQLGEDVRIDMIDRMPVPYGLIRFGVAPDHQSIKAVYKRYEKVALADNVRFVGNVCVGRDVSIDELKTLYDAIVLATGAPDDRPLGIPGDDLPGVIGSAAFVGWYNGHPEFADLAPPLDVAAAAVVGNGNVALDVARILAKTPAEFAGSDIVAHAFGALGAAAIHDIHVLGRRGPHQIAMTPKELGELGHLAQAVPKVEAEDFPPEMDDALLEPGLRKSVTHLREFAKLDGADKPKTIHFDFFAKPLRIEGDDKVERIIVEKTKLDERQAAVGTGETYAIPCGMVVSCIGYKTPPIEGVPYEADRGRFANSEGVIGDGLYCVGWARRGPTGTIGTNRPDGYEVAERIVADIAGGARKQGGDGLDRLLATRGTDVVTFHDWQRIEAAETARAREGSPREKFVAIAEMLGARGR